MKLKYILPTFIILFFIIACGGGTSGGSDNSSQQLLAVDSAVKAENTLYEISQNSSDLFALTGWAEMVLEEINNQLVEQEEKETSPYHDLKLACPFKGTMLINGSIAINGSMEYDIDVLLDNCYLDDITSLQGNITFKGSASEDIAQNMKIVMSNYHIGLHMLKETTVNASIEVSNSLANDTYQTNRER